MVSKRVEVGPEDRVELERIVRSRRAERRMVERAGVVLGAAEGLSAREIAARVGCSEKLAGRWRARYEREGIDGLLDRPRSGRPLTHQAEARALLIAKACTKPPETAEGQRRERWTHRELAEQVGMSESQAHVILSRAEIKPHRTQYWVMTDFDQPGFEERAGEVCGLYLDPPAGALVLSIDEKTSVQAKGLARPDTPPEPGKGARRDYEYTRNGTMNLFAALRVHTGEAHAMTSKTRNRFDLIRFLEEIDETISPAKGRQIIAIMDNLSTHTSHDVKAWLKAHPHWRFVFTPNHASWLNQVECFFSILARRLLKHGHFDTPEDLAEQMLAFVETHNQTATPFQWTYTGKILGA
ncbi:MAG: IS630 family transposase [Actinobacteria bacterium]|nr:IS630 family transposase [Actinomycetota bacterium]